MIQKINRIIAFDPGTHLVHWAMLEGNGQRQTFLEGGSIPSEPADIVKLLDSQEYDLGAVEVIEKYFRNPERGGADGTPLIRCSRTSGICLGLLHPTPTFKMTASAPAGQMGWRSFLTGQRAGSDALVKSVLLVRGIITRQDEANEHVRDAIGLGAVALMLKGHNW
jgi:hypothetical protein